MTARAPFFARSVATSNTSVKPLSEKDSAASKCTTFVDVTKIETKLENGFLYLMLQIKKDVVIVEGYCFLGSGGGGGGVICEIGF